jgi:hypothetical protein
MTLSRTCDVLSAQATPKPVVKEACPIALSRTATPDPFEAMPIASPVPFGVRLRIRFPWMTIPKLTLGSVGEEIPTAEKFTRLSAPATPSTTLSITSPSA